MKPKTVILLVICGCLFMLVGAFAVFFARGGEVLVMGSYDSNRHSHPKTHRINADENIVDAMVGLDFTFEPMPGLVAHFHQAEKQKVPVYHTVVTNESVERFVEDRFDLVCTLKLKGKARQAIPSGHFYSDLTQDEFYDQLQQEIKSRIGQPDASFEIKCVGFEFWGELPFQLKKLPTK